MGNSPTKATDAAPTTSPPVDLPPPPPVTTVRFPRKKEEHVLALGTTDVEEQKKERQERAVQWVLASLVAGRLLFLAWQRYRQRRRGDEDGQGEEQ